MANTSIKQAFEQFWKHVIARTGDMITQANEYTDTQVATKPGEKTTGKTYTINDSSVTAGEGAEVFNNYTSNKACGEYSHAEGYYTTASNLGAHAEGRDTTASGRYSHAEGFTTTASNLGAHAEGYFTTASELGAHAEGRNAIASNSGAHAEGCNTTASGKYSHAGGSHTTANDYQYVVGRYNKNTTAPTSLTDTTATAGIFMVGVGTSDTNLLNGFRVNPAGKVYAQSTLTAGTGADYAEYFEWVDGNPEDEDRRGRFVTLDGEKIRYANAEDNYVLGIVSANPAVLGDAQMEIWNGKYLNDVYGAKIEEMVEVEETEDEFGNIVPAHTERRWVLNPDYNPDEEYIPREERIEWDAIGIVGKLVVVDDGTCEVNGYCYPSTEGIATASESETAYRVMERLDDAHVRVFVK